MLNKEGYNEVGGGLNVDAMWPEKGTKLSKGDSVEGRYVEKVTGVGPRGSNVYVIENNEGKRVGVWGGTVIDSRFVTIAIGKKIGIEFLGLQKTKDGAGTYKAFWVGVGVDHIGDEGGRAEAPDVKDIEEIEF